MKGSYLRRFWIGMVLYAALLIVTVTWRARLGDGLLPALFVLLPMLPAVYAMVAVFQSVQQQDELIRRIHVESILITALATAAITFGWGLLEAAQLIPPMPVIWIAPGMIAIWGIANALIARRYT